MRAMLAITLAPGCLAATLAAADERRPPEGSAPPAGRVAPQDQALYEKLCLGVAAEYDSERGGFVGKDGAPSESAIELALLLGRDREDSPWSREGVHTARWTIGLFDSVGGGFFHGPKDKSPASTDFNKPTMDNVRRITVMLDAWRLTDEDVFRRVAARTVDYCDRVLLDGRGGFVHGQIGDRTLVPESNGPAIAAWLEFGVVRGDPHFRGFAWKSLYLVFGLQAVLAWIIAAPLAAAISSPAPLGALDALGFGLALFGLAFETVADAQLARFKADPASAGKVMDRGLWRYTRHPNYFGDACVWWGIWLAALEAGWLAALLGLPGLAFLTFTLTRWSGAGMTEAAMSEK